MATFVDRVVLHLQAGDGGHGCVSVHREKFKPLGGPDGGNGGHGGGITLVVDPQQHTLLDFHFRPHVKAQNGTGGAGGNRDGANGGDLVLKVPDGTVDQGEQRVVAPTADAAAGVEVGAPLAHDDLTGVHDLPAETLHTEALSRGIAPVARA